MIWVCLAGTFSGLRTYLHDCAAQHRHEPRPPVDTKLREDEVGEDLEHDDVADLQDVEELARLEQTLQTKKSGVTSMR